jgi:hypothetical protein
MGFNIAGVREIKACTSVAFLNQLDLGVCRRRGNCSGLSVLVESSISDDSVNPVTSLECSVKRLKNKCCDTLATTVSVGTLIPSEAFAFCTDSTMKITAISISFWSFYRVTEMLTLW